MAADGDGTRGTVNASRRADDDTSPTGRYETASGAPRALSVAGLWQTAFHSGGGGGGGCITSGASTDETRSNVPARGREGDEGP